MFKLAQLRSWNFEGSKNGLNWICLREHKGDKSLQEKHDTKTWEIDNAIDFYQYFRIKMTGTDSSLTWFIFCSGFEIYGEVQE